jgi:hypothetical protein
LICGLQAATDRGDASCAALKAQAIDQKRKPSRTDAKAAMRGGIKAEPQLIEALIASIDSIAQAGQSGLRRQTSKALSRTHQMEVARMLHTGDESRYAVFNVLLRSGDQLSSRGWSSSAQVSDKVRNSEVRLVADGGYDRELRGCDRTSKPLIVETSEVF